MQCNLAARPSLFGRQHHLARRGIVSKPVSLAKPGIAQGIGRLQRLSVKSVAEDEKVSSTRKGEHAFDWMLRHVPLNSCLLNPCINSHVVLLAYLTFYASPTPRISPTALENYPNDPIFKQDEELDEYKTPVQQFLFPDKEDLPDDFEMPIWDHLEELRERVMVALLACTVAIGTCFAFSKELIIFLEAPVADAGVRFLQLSPGEFFFTTLKVSRGHGSSSMYTWQQAMAMSMAMGDLHASFYGSAS